MELKTQYIRKNGEIIGWDNALDHNLTHSLHYGGGCFEGIRFYNTISGPKIFKLKEHIDRLFYSAGVLNLVIPFSKEQIIADTINLVAKNGIESGYIRHIVYSGYGKMGLYPIGAKKEVVISVWKWGKYLSNDPIKVKIAKTRRIHPATTDIKAKISGNYANSILVSHEIKGEGFDEGLLLDTDGYIAEGPGENFFLVKGNQIITPSLGTILPGITRATVIELLDKELGIKVEERKINPDELGNFTEAFFTGTAAEVTPIGSITRENGITYKYNSGVDSKITSKIKKLYEEVVTGKLEKYSNRLY